MLEVSPRGLAFSLSTLAGMGHPTHLALIDAYLRGEVSLPRHVGLGQDSRLTLSRLIGPLVLAYERGVAECGLGDLILLPADDGDALRQERSCRVVLAPTPTFVVTTTGAPSGVHPPPPEMTERPGWVVVDVEIPSVAALERHLADAGPPAPIDASALIVGVGPSSLVRNAQPGPLTPLDAALIPAVLAALKRLAFGQAAGNPLVVLAAVGALGSAVERDRPRWSGETWLHARELLVAATRITPAVASNALSELGRCRPEQLAGPVRVAARDRRPAAGVVEHAGLTIDLALTPAADGGATLALLPPVEQEALPNLVECMESAARVVLPGLMGVPFGEERKEVIEHRLVGPARTTTLLVGWSLVLPRNRRVFAAWLGSDGRVSIRLFPPEGQGSRGAAP